MGFGKIWAVLFCLILIAGLFFLRGGVSDLQKKADAWKDAAQKAEDALKEWKTSFSAAAVPTQTTPEETPAEDEAEPEPANAEPDFSCVLRLCNGKIGIFTDEGYAIRFLETDARTLPPADVAALEEGVPIRSRAELLERMEDFGE